MIRNTFQRKKILVSSYSILWESINKMRTKHNIDLIAWVVMPDHFHMLIDPKESDVAAFIHDVKLSFGAYYRKEQNIRSGRVWQNRFWDHVIRNQDDMNRHIDYIHYNPVKHGYTNNPNDWKYSSFSEYKEKGYYQDDWGAKDEIIINGEFGE